MPRELWEGNVALLIIETDNTTSEARDWLASLMEDILDGLDMEQCIEVVNGDTIADNIVNQIGHLSSSTIDNLFTNAIESLLE